MISKDSTIIQVVITKTTKQYIERYNKIFGGSLSSFAKMAIEHFILNHCCEDKKC